MTERPAPVRTCVGCRIRAAKSDLLRVVAVAEPPQAVVPDPRGTMPGRGAHLHPDPTCLALAERRRAFGRALRLTGAPDVAAVRAHIAQVVDNDDRTVPERADDSDERSMSQHR